MIRNTLRRLPLYAQIKSVLIRRIGEGEWHADEALPSEWALAAELDVSQGTVRKALGELVTQGVLYRRQGRGTFVAEVESDWGPGVLVTPGLWSEKPDDTVLEFLGCSHGNASDEVAQVLRLRRGAPVIQVRQLWRIRGQPVALDEAFLPAEPFEGLDSRSLRQCGGRVYVTLQRRFGVRPRVAAEQARAVLLSREEAALLGQSPGEAVLSLLRVSATMEGEPVEWRQRLCLTRTLALMTGRVL